MSQVNKRIRRDRKRQAKYDELWSKSQGVSVARLATPRKYYGVRDTGEHFTSYPNPYRRDQ